MPIYSFVCRACGERFEELVARMGQVAPCPKCSSAEVERQLTAPADYRGGSNAAAEACEACHAGELPSCCPGGACGLG